MTLGFVFFLTHAFQSFGVINVDACWINNFILGYFYSKCCNNKEQNNIFEILVIVGSLIVIPLAIIYQEKLPIVLPGLIASKANYIINYGHVLLGSLLFIFLYKVFDKYKLNKNVILTFSDKYSYYIYLVHQIFILKSLSVLFLTKYLIVNILLILLLSIVSAIIIKKLSDMVLKITQYLFNYVKR